MLNQQQWSKPQPEDQPSGDNRPVEELTLAMQAANGSVAIPEVTQYRPQGNQSWRWMLISLMSCVAASGAAIGAFVWLINLPPTADCENPAAVTTDRARLYCAQIAAETGELDDILASLDLVGSWTSSHPLYYEVQPLVEQWSWVALQEAQQKLSDSDLDGAVALIDYIPPSSPVYETAQASLQAWNTEWEQGDKIWTDAQTALKNQDWATASQQVSALSKLENRHWRVDQVQALSRQLRQERRARRQLTAALALASSGGRTRLGAALRAVSQIDDTTYAYQDGQSYMDRWSDWLLNLGLDHWYASELDEAISLGRDVAHNPNRAKPAQELIWLSRSRQMAQQSVGTWRTSPDQLMRLYRAMIVANQIPKDSPYYPQAQSSVETWHTHLEDLGTIQMAQVVGRLQHLDTLKLAIDQAAKVPPEHPRRHQAQTLMAHWRLEVERLEDRPYLAEAHQLAGANTIDGLQQAIESAGRIPINRALRNEAQGWIYVWRNKIEVLEDSPILDQARALADQGNYSRAIAEATNVKAGRALFEEAQAAITDWRREIYAIEQARQRALQQAAARRAAANATAKPIEPADPSAPGSEHDSPDSPASLIEIPPLQPVAPAPVSMPPPRKPLPTRIETVPGNRPATESIAPVLPPVPQPPTLTPPPTSAPSDSVAPAVENLGPPSQPVAPPTTNPAPLDQLPPSELSVPVPAAPAPQWPGVPQPPQSGVTSPAPVVPEATKPVTAPSVSAQPAPEQAVNLKTTQDMTILYTGSLYAGR